MTTSKMLTQDEIDGALFVARDAQSSRADLRQVINQLAGHIVASQQPTAEDLQLGDIRTRLAALEELPLRLTHVEEELIAMRQPVTDWGAKATIGHVDDVVLDSAVLQLSEERDAHEQTKRGWAGQLKALAAEARTLIAPLENIIAQVDAAPNRPYFDIRLMPINVSLLRAALAAAKKISHAAPAYIQAPAADAAVAAEEQ